MGLSHFSEPGQRELRMANQIRAKPPLSKASIRTTSAVPNQTTAECSLNQTEETRMKKITNEENYVRE